MHAHHIFAWCHLTTLNIGHAHYMYCTTTTHSMNVTGTSTVRCKLLAVIESRAKVP